MLNPTAKDIMHPRLSISARDRVPDILKRLISPYSALPVVNERFEVMGIITEHDILYLINEKRDTYGSLAQSIMICGHPDHSHCGGPVTVSRETPIEEIVKKMYLMKLSMLPVVEDGNRLVGYHRNKADIDRTKRDGFLGGPRALENEKGISWRNRC